MPLSQLLVVAGSLGVPWLVDTSLQSLRPLSRGLFLSASLCFHVILL